VIASEIVSFDSVMESPEQWRFPYFNDELEEANAAGVADSDALLLGRLSYQELGDYQPG
jgi:hypothetical protein